MFTLEQINELLHNVAVITFTKKSDGSTRVMKCTKNLDNIDTKYHPIGSSRVVDVNQVRVFDLEKSAWRSFDINNVISAEQAV